jgi:hypothetical protein
VTDTKVTPVTGFGVEATVTGARIQIGADRFMRQLGLDIASFDRMTERVGDEGKTPLYAAIDGKLAAIIAVADPIKASTPEAFATLHELGAAIITSNLPLDERNAIFDDGRLTGAVLERLIHHAHILEMNGSFNRLAQRRSRRSS